LLPFERNEIHKFQIRAVKYFADRGKVSFKGPVLNPPGQNLTTKAEYGIWDERNRKTDFCTFISQNRRQKVSNLRAAITSPARFGCFFNFVPFNEDRYYDLNLCSLGRIAHDRYLKLGILQAS
jgi:hypothetical protein